MNLIKLITDQLSSDALAKLTAILGVDREDVESAVTAAVPSVLAGIGGLATHEDGIRKLSSTLDSLDDSMFGNFDRQLSSDAGTMLQKGNRLLNGLFGEGLSSNLANALSRFTGLSPDAVRSLLAYLTPLILGRVASQWRNQGGTTTALTNLFRDQGRAIEDALPSGFSLDDVPGLAHAGELGRAATRAATSGVAASKSLVSTLVPLALVVAGALLLWSFLRGREQPQEAGVNEVVDESAKVVALKPILSDAPSLTDVGEMKQDLTNLFQDFGTAFAGIKDGPSAEAALPGLEELNRRLDATKKTLTSLPDASRTALAAFMNEPLESIKAQAAKVLSLPGLAEQIKSLIHECVRKLDEFQKTEPTP
jgi:hypothetical protein